MKPMGGTAESVKRGIVSAEELLRYAMSLPVATTICGMDNPDVLDKNLAIARGFQPMSASDRQALEQRCAQAAGDGRFELYKVSLKYDNPETRQPHGFPYRHAAKRSERVAANEGPRRRRRVAPVRIVLNWDFWDCKDDYD